jgi:hypothetical protein
LYPDVKMVIGPVIAEGFYYDIAYERPFTPDDLAAIEQRMQELIAQDYDVIKKMTPRAEVDRRLQGPWRGLQAAPDRGHARTSRPWACTTTRNTWTCAVARTCRTRVSSRRSS